MENSYDIIAVLDNGWTKIDYDGQVGYISSEYVKYQIKTVYNGIEDNASFIDATDAEIDEYRKADSNPPAPPVVNTTETTDEAVNNIISEMHAGGD